MIGKEGSREFSCVCCDWSRGKRAMKAIEENRWRDEADHEMSDWPHENGICYNPNGAGYGCDLCDTDYDDAYDNSDLDGIEGVWCDVDWRNYFQDWELELLTPVMIRRTKKYGPLQNQVSDYFRTNA